MKKLLYLGIDGCRPDSLEKANTPNLDKLIESGVFINNALTCTHSNSGSCWSSLLTGVWENKHGVMDNSFVGAMFHEYPTIFQRLFESSKSIKSRTVVNWTSRHHPSMEGVVSYHLEASDALVCERACTILNDESVDLLYVLYSNVDATGHKAEFSPENHQYIEAIETADLLVGNLMTCLDVKRTNNPKTDWLIAVVTDHGGVGNDHGGASLPERQIFQIYNSPTESLTTLEHEQIFSVDLPVTVLKYFDIDIDENWMLDGKPLISFAEKTPIINR